MSRKEFSKTIKGQAAKRAAGHCEECGKKLRVGEFHYDHIVADGLGGTPTLDNCMVLCLPCHKDKTHLHDNPIMQKADRQRKSIGMGIKTRKGLPMIGSRDSDWKRKMDGSLERRSK